MTNKDSNSLDQTEIVKYKPTKTRKISIVIGSVSLSLSFIIGILGVYSLIRGYMMLLTILLLHMISMIACIIILVDVVRFNKKNHINENSDSNIAIWLILGIVLGFILGKIY